MTDLTYRPRDAVFFARPVQVGTVQGLTGAHTPGGRGVLVWKDGSAIRFATVPSFRDFGIDDVVAPGDVGTVVDFPGELEVVRPTISRVGSELMVVTSRQHGNPGQVYVEVWVPDSVETPTSWSLRGRIQDYAGLAFDSASVSATATGRIHRLPSGRLAIVAGLWDTFLGANFQHAGVWTSDNSGATWTLRYDLGLGFVGGSYIAVFPGALGWDPVTGRYWFPVNASPFGGVEDSSDLLTWNHENTGSDTPTGFPIEDNGTRSYFGDLDGNIRQVDDLSIYNGVYAGMPTTGYRWLPPGETLSGAANKIQSATRFLVVPSGPTFGFYKDDRVAVSSSGGFLVGAVGVG